MSLRSSQHDAPSRLPAAGAALVLVSFVFFTFFLNAIDLWFYVVGGVGTALFCYLFYRFVLAVERIARALERE
jgi:hypothetical protein